MIISSFGFWFLYLIIEYAYLVLSSIIKLGILFLYLIISRKSGVKCEDQNTKIKIKFSSSQYQNTLCHRLQKNFQGRIFI